MALEPKIVHFRARQLPFRSRGPEIDPRSIRGRSDMTEIVTRSSEDLVQQDVTN